MSSGGRLLLLTLQSYVEFPRHGIFSRFFSLTTSDKNHKMRQIAVSSAFFVALFKFLSDNNKGGR